MQRPSTLNVVFLLVLLLVVGPAISVLVAYGTISPCGALRSELLREVNKRALVYPQFSALAVGLGSSMVDNIVDSLGPLECCKGLLRVWAGLGPAEASVTNTPDHPSEVPLAPKVGLAQRGTRPWLSRGQGCKAAFEVISGSGDIFIKMFALGSSGTVLGSSNHYSPIAVGSLIEFTFTDARCQDIVSFRW